MITPVKPIPKYGTQAPNAALGQVNVYNPNTGAPLEGAGAFNPNNGARVQQTPINANILGNTQPLNITPKDTSSTTDNLAIANNSAAASVGAEANAPDPVVSPEKKGLKDSLNTLLGNVSKQAEAENQARKDEQLAEKKQKAKAIETELDVLDKNFRDEAKQIRESSGGSVAGANAAISAAQTKYEDRRANVALAYKVASDDYNGSAEIVNQKIASIEKQNDQAFKAYQLQKDLVYDSFTEAEKVAIDEQTKIKEETRKTNNDTYATILANAVQNKAPASVLSAIDEAARAPGASAATISTAAGKYGADPLVAAQIGSANRANQPDPAVTPGTISPYQQERINRNLEAIDRLEQGVNFVSTGIGSTFDWLPGSVPRDFKAQVNTLKSNIAFGELTAMREASKTGGALGAISERELILLESALGSLDTGQSPGQFKKQLQIIKGSIQRWQSANNQYGTTQQERITTAPDGTQVIIID